MSGYEFLRKCIAFAAAGIGPILLWYSYAYNKWHVIIIFVVFGSVLDYYLRVLIKKQKREEREKKNSN